MVTNQGLLEISELSSRAETLARGTPADRAQSAVLLARIKSVREQECSSDEMRSRYTGALVEEVGSGEVDERRYQRGFEHMVRFGDKIHTDTPEFRDLLVGTSTIAYTNGPQGGYGIPLLYLETVGEGMSQTDPVLSANLTDFVMEDSTTLQPMTVQGFDLSVITAQLISEAGQQLAQPFPAISGGKVLRGNRIWRTAVSGSLEAEQDIRGYLQKICRAFGVGFGRSLGQAAVQDLLVALPTSSYSTGPGIVTANDILAIYFNVNRFHRNQSKCSWLMSDFSYERVRKAVDSQGRPLISLIDDREMLLGKPLHVSPSFGGGGSPTVGGTIAFGDFSHWHLRCSRPTLMRSINVANSGAEFGKAYFTGRIRFDSQYLDESAGVFPPVTIATVTP